MNSTPPYSRFLTGLTNLAGHVAKNTPGKKASLISSFSFWEFAAVDELVSLSSVAVESLEGK